MSASALLPPRRQSRPRLALVLLSLLLLGFFCGGVAGAWMFKQLGYVATVPLARIAATPASSRIARV